MDKPENSGPIAFICAMPMELSPLVKKLSLTQTEVDGVTVHRGTLDGRDVVAIVTGMGTKLAADATERLLNAFEVERVVVFGITGAVENDSTPAFTANSALSSCVAPSAAVERSPAAMQANTSAENARKLGRCRWTLVIRFLR